MIPRIVHQTWKDAKIDYWIFKRSQASVALHLADWEYRLWTDADLDSLVKEDFPEFHEAWKALDRHIKRVDTARYCILYKHGGLYADLDFIFTRGIDDLIDDEHDIFFYKSTQAIVKNWEFLGNALMISEPKQQFWLDALRYMFSLPANTGVLHHTGPRALGAYYASLTDKPKVKILGPDIFDNERCQDGIGARTHGYHVRTATWQRAAIG